MQPFLAGLFVFAMRVTDMSLDTLRLRRGGCEGTARGGSRRDGVYRSGQGRDRLGHQLRRGTQKISAVRAIIDQVDPSAFVAVDEVRPLQHEYFRH